MSVPQNPSSLPGARRRRRSQGRASFLPNVSNTQNQHGPHRQDHRGCHRPHRDQVGPLLSEHWGRGVRPPGHVAAEPPLQRHHTPPDVQQHRRRGVRRILNAVALPPFRTWLIGFGHDTTRYTRRARTTGTHDDRQQNHNLYSDLKIPLQRQHPTNIKIAF